MSNFNPFSAALAATKKAIKAREDKITAQQELENLALDFDKRGEMAYESGCLEAQVMMTRGAEKKAVQAKLTALKKQRAKIDKAFSSSGTARMLKLQGEIIELKSSLSQIENLFKQWEDREARIREMSC
ncbi:hypothetical protein [Vibrio sp. ABG19]|uniref:hypothetical protein n=1 Tax=Vibrio sp. ABG19 TaxID=2817385 RepID=UPI00249DDB0C|nr:hypothetical protein [Vibrio sp. ABG19]WGY45256.1 hypothetical protein J0X00_06070 [Vibrio sp. ABG19]